MGARTTHAGPEQKLAGLWSQEAKKRMQVTQKQRENKTRRLFRDMLSPA